MRIHSPSCRVRVFSAALQALEPRTLLSTVITVTNTNDHGTGSLRAAITQANTYTADTEVQIKFKIPGSGVQTIEPLSPLPAITAMVDIEGPSDSNGNPLIQIDGQSAGNGTIGLDFERDTPGNALSSDVYGLAINRFSNSAIKLAGDGAVTVYGCRIGTDPTGKKNRGNGGQVGAIVITSANDQIGMPLKGAQYPNVISDNAGETGIAIEPGGTGATIENCIIGTDITGKTEMPNYSGIYVDVAHVTIGGVGPFESNLISGNHGAGIDFDSGGSNAQVLANRIGTNAAGTAAIGNADGIYFYDCTDDVIGDGIAAGSNLISGNAVDGIDFFVANQNQISDNLIGTNAADTAAVPNGQYGLSLSSSSSNSLYKDVISGNGNNGVYLYTPQGLSAAQGNTISQCDIGIDATGKIPLGNNADGILINSASDTQITSCTIDFNKDAGVQIMGANASGNQLNGGSIYNNKSLGIVLGANLTTPLPNVTPGSVAANTQPNDDLDYPVLTSAQDIGVKFFPEGTYQGTPNSTYTILFYADAAADSSGYGQGQTYVASEQVTTNSSGSADIGEAIYGPPSIAAGSVLTAVAEQMVTGGADTSEFAQDVPVTGAYVTGNVFDDANGNGKQDSGEKGLANETVYMDDFGTGVYHVGDPSATTNSKGNYSLFVPPGTDHIRIVIPSGYEQTDPSSKKPYYKISVANNSTTEFTGINFGLMPTPAKSAVVAPTTATDSTTNDPAALVITRPISFGVFFSERALLTT
jgi:hypothetical protein